MTINCACRPSPGGSAWFFRTREERNMSMDRTAGGCPSRLTSRIRRTQPWLVGGLTLTLLLAVGAIHLVMGDAAAAAGGVGVGVSTGGVSVATGGVGVSTGGVGVSTGGGVGVPGGHSISGGVMPPESL